MQNGNSHCNVVVCILELDPRQTPRPNKRPDMQMPSIWWEKIHKIMRI